MKILIADDHAEIRKGIISLIQQEFMDAEILETANGNETLEKVRDQDWDIILLDISMPGRNGLETLKQLRADGIKAPILMVSMQPVEQYASRSLNAGASGYVNKYNVSDDLIPAVRRALDGHAPSGSDTPEK